MQAVADARKFFQLSAGEKKRAIRFDGGKMSYLHYFMIVVFCK